MQPAMSFRLSIGVIRKVASGLAVVVLIFSMFGKAFPTSTPDCCRGKMCPIHRKHAIPAKGTENSHVDCEHEGTGLQSCSMSCGRSDDAVITWFTAAQDQPTVNLAFSDDGGASFSAPIRVDEGRAVGRAQAVLLPGRLAVVFWLEHVSGTTRLLARVAHDDGLMEKPIEVSRGSDLGYPHAARAADGVLITWAEGDAVRHVHVALFPYAGHEEMQ
jgi:hypothetical protein